MAVEARPLAGAHAGGCKKFILSQMTTGNNAKKTKMSRQRLGPSSPSGRSIHFGEGQAETSQARQRLGVSCGLLSALPLAFQDGGVLGTGTACGSASKRTRRAGGSAFVAGTLPDGGGDAA